MPDEFTTQIRAALRKHAIETGTMYDFGRECVPLDDVAARVAAALSEMQGWFPSSGSAAVGLDRALRALRGEP